MNNEEDFTEETESSPLVPEWEELGVEVDDAAEPEDAGVDHDAEPNEVDDGS